MTLIQAFVPNTGSPYKMVREKHKWKISMRLNIEARKDGGRCCSSVEVRVIGMEQRASIISFENVLTTLKEDD
jgi:hypothetical protein